MQQLRSDTEVIEQILKHIDQGTTDLGTKTWQEPTDNYVSQARFEAEISLLRQVPVAYAPSVLLPEPGHFLARNVAGLPIVVVRDRDGQLRAFHNVCRHRGMTLVQGSGKTAALRCTYHGWAYNLEGSLQHVPHEDGFPRLDRSCHGLVPINSVVEMGGLIYVCIEAPIDNGALCDMPELISPHQKVFQSEEYSQSVNWKLNMEATMEGYHIKPTHEKTFYPFGYDNLNLVETFGRNSRVTFPFRRIEKLRDVPCEDWDVSGKLTYVYSVFPACTIAVLSNHISVSISEPLSPGKTHYYTYKLGKLDGNETSDDIERMQRDARFVSDTGLKEDNAVVSRIQQGLKTNANPHFTYGLFEKAIVHLHSNLQQLIG